MGTLRAGSRRIVGVTGKPGAGKTTYALGLAAASGVPAAYVPAAPAWWPVTSSSASPRACAGVGGARR